MNVCFVADQGNADGTVGGAELTIREFAGSAPEGVTVTHDVAAADVVVIGNCVTFHPDVINALHGKHVIRYHNDLARHEHPELRGWLERNADHVFTSPMHQRLYGMAGDWPNIPPAVDLERFRPPDSEPCHTGREKGVTCARGGIGCPLTSPERHGTCAIAPWQNPGKGQQLLREWSDTHEPVDVYGTGHYTPHGPNLNTLGPIPPEQVPETLWTYRRFVHLPTAPEPFGRAVVEAWAAGCELVVNRQVGALHYLEHDRDALTTAAADFWDLVAGRVTA